MTARTVLAALLCGPMLMAAARVVHVQSTLTPRFAEVWQSTTETQERIPARTGRILTADGVVIARDVTRDAVEVDYRWVEEPPNPRWLRRTALRRLPRMDRSETEKVLAEEKRVLAERAAAWARLDELHPPLAAERAALQRKVERIRDAVERKRSERNQPSSDDAGFLSRIWSELSNPPRRSNDADLVLAEEVAFHPVGVVPPELIREVRDRPTYYAGIRVSVTPQRSYPRGSFASHLIGYRTPRRGDEPEGRYTSVGRNGVERSYQRLLGGRDGRVSQTRRWDGTVEAEREESPPIHGRDVTLTLDSRLQASAEAAVDGVLESKPDALGAVLVVMDVETGAIRAAAVGPRPSPRMYLDGTAGEWAVVNDDPRRPLVNRLHQMALPPGSVFKLVTALAACGSGWPEDRTLFCQGFFQSPERERCAVFVAGGYGHDAIALDTALARSCNVFFFQVATQLGGDRLRDWSGRCGVGWQTGIDVGGEASGGFPTDFAYPGDLRQAAIGQGAVTMTPLQVVRVAAAIANGGVLVTPRLCEDAPVGRERLHGVDASNTAVLRRGMRQAVLSGTASSLSDLPVAGKTGTAETGGGRPSHAWFAGYFPADDPRYAVVAVVEHGGGGGRVAAPMVRAVVPAGSAGRP